MQQMNEEDAKVIDEVLDQAIEAGLEVEVIYWALRTMKDNPKLTPSEAMILGVTEWIK